MVCGGEGGAVSAHGRTHGVVVFGICMHACMHQMVTDGTRTRLDVLCVSWCADPLLCPRAQVFDSTRAWQEATQLQLIKRVIGDAYHAGDGSTTL